MIDKSPTLRGPICQDVLGFVFHRFPGTSIRPHYMPVKRAECFPFRDFLTLFRQVGREAELLEQQERNEVEVCQFHLAYLGFYSKAFPFVTCLFF